MKRSKAYRDGAQLVAYLTCRVGHVPVGPGPVVEHARHERGAVRGDGRVVDVTFLGNISRARVAWKGRDILVQTGHVDGIVPGADVAVSVVPSVCGWVRA